MLDLKGLLSKARLPMDITRRGFLEVSTVAAAVAAMNAARAQTGAQPYIILSAPKGILIADPSLCVSCQRCELACTEFNDGKADPRLARIKINRGMFYGTEGTSLTSPHNGAYGSDPVCVQDNLPPVRPPGSLRQRLPERRHPRQSEDRCPLCR